MKVKIFFDSGGTGVQKMEKNINDWLDANGAAIEIDDRQTAMCTVSDSGDGERYQMLAVTIWYTEKSN